MKKYKLIVSLILLFQINFALAEDMNNLQNKIYKNLRCLICQGQSVAESNSDFALTLKLVVKDLLQEGKNEKEVYDFLTEKYGDWIVYRPKFNTLNSFLWIVPYFILILGGIIIFKIIKTRKS
tara:strand:- start:3432 stop:3800 length:369 start_codon:yes stop_codon:yes gene_type:complete